MQLAIDVLRWPGVNQAFLVSFVLSNAMAFAAIPYAKRRPVGTPLSWGESMLASVYVFATLFIAFGIVPHQWLSHADKDLGWNRAKLIYGPFDLLKPQAFGGWFPFNISYEALRDVIVAAQGNRPLPEKREKNRRNRDDDGNLEASQDEEGDD